MIAREARGFRAHKCGQARSINCIRGAFWISVVQFSTGSWQSTISCPRPWDLFRRSDRRQSIARLVTCHHSNPQSQRNESVRTQSNVQQTMYADSLSEYTYVAKFPEYKGPSHYEPWSIRQFSIYHCYDVKLTRSVYILISPTEKSTIETSMLRWLGQADPNTNQFTPNKLLWDAYFDNWRPYLLHYDHEFQSLVSLVSPLNVLVSNTLDSQTT